MNTSGHGSRVLATALAVVLLAGLASGCKASQEAADNSVGRGVSGSAPSVAPNPSGVVPGDTLTEEYAGDKATQTSPASESTTGEVDRMVIRSKVLRLEVESTSDAVAAVRDLGEKHSAVITDLQVATDTEDWLYRYDEYGYAVGDGVALRGWITVRVPAEALDAFMSEAIALGTVKYQAEDTEDVTQQHVDLSARLENLRAEETRLRTFFDAAKNVQEMLAVETELNRVRGEIESMDAQVKYLERQAAMATVTIELTEKRAVVRPEGESWGFSEAITDGFRGAAGVVTFAIAFVIATAPLWIVGLIVLFAVRAVIRSRRRKAAAVASARADSTPVVPTDEPGV